MSKKGFQVCIFEHTVKEREVAKNDKNSPTEFPEQVPVNETFDDMLKLFWEISELSRPSVLELVSTPALPVDWPPEELARAISGALRKGHVKRCMFCEL